MYKTILRTTSLSLLFLMLAISVQGQDFNPENDTSTTSATLKAGFLLDPYAVRIIGGGSRAIGSIVGSIYIVERGDTLYSIGKRFGVSVAELAAVNWIDDTNKISSGERLIIPQLSGLSRQTFNPGECTVSITADVAIYDQPNGREIGTVSSGVVIHVVESRLVNGQLWFRMESAMATHAEWVRNSENARFNEDVCQVETPEAIVGSIYIVERGDTLYSIGKQFGVSVAELAAVNWIDDTNKISSGERLIIPQLSGLSRQTFNPGECTVSITADVAIYDQPNGREIGTVSSGVVIHVVESRLVNGQLWFRMESAMATHAEWVRNSENARFNEDVCQVETPEAIVGSIYIVERGDTLYSIGKQFGVSVAELAAVNWIDDTNKISSGERLIIPQLSGLSRQTFNPGECTVSITADVAIYDQPNGREIGTVSSGVVIHVVESRLVNGQLWFRMESAMATHAEWVRNSENARFNEDVCQVETPEAIVGSIYIVERGDTLYSIGKQFGVSVAELAAVNWIDDTNKISSGERLIIPQLSGLSRRTFNPGECTVSITADVAIYDQPNGREIGTVSSGVVIHVVESRLVNGQLWFRMESAMATHAEWVRNSENAFFNEDVCQVM